MSSTLSYCPNYSGILRRARDDGGIDVLPCRCKSWSCEYCSPINAKRLRYAIARQIPSLGVTQAVFGTITASGKNRTPLSTYNALHKAWPILRQWIIRHYGPFQYVAIYERHKDGAYHLHWLAMWTNTIPDEHLARRLKRQIKDNAPKWGIGYIADVQPIENGVEGVIRYVTKAITTYIVKDAPSSKAGLPKYARLFYLSRGIKSSIDDFGDEGAGEWLFGGRVSIEEVVNKVVYAINEHRFLSARDFGDDEHYWPPLPQNRCCTIIRNGQQNTLP